MNLHKRTFRAYTALILIVLPVCFLTAFIWQAFSGVKPDQLVFPLVGLGVFFGAIMSLPQIVGFSSFLKAVIVFAGCLLLLVFMPYLKVESIVVFWFFTVAGVFVTIANASSECRKLKDERDSLISDKAGTIALIIACLYLFFGVFALTWYAGFTDSDVVAVKDLTFLITWFVPVCILVYSLAGMHYARKYGTEADE